LKRCEIGCNLVLQTNKKSHTGYRLVQKLVTVNDTEQHRLIADTMCYYAECVSFNSLQPAIRQIGLKRPILSAIKNVAQRMLVFGNKRLMATFKEIDENNCVNVRHPLSKAIL